MYGVICFNYHMSVDTFARRTKREILQYSIKKNEKQNLHKELLEKHCLIVNRQKQNIPKQKIQDNSAKQ